MENIDFTLEPFNPPKWLTNPHLQTLTGRLVRRHQDVTFRRERVETPDGDFVDLDFADVKGQTWADLGEEAPIILMLHGLAGSARQGYSYESYHQLAQRGIRAAGLNFRGCSGERNRTRYMYHAGSTEDVHLIVNLLHNRYPHVPLGIVGVSLGANMLLKYLGERETTFMKAGAVISPPFDLKAGAHFLSQGSGKLYTRVLLRRLKQDIRAKKELIQPHVYYRTAMRATTFPVFDNATIAPLYGYQDANDYYAQNSARIFLANIAVPTLLLRALDDPFLDPEAIPWHTIQENPYLINGIIKYGGHVGFIEGESLPHLSSWAERQMARFMAHTLLPLASNSPLKRKTV